MAPDAGRESHPEVARIVALALAEDLGDEGDITSRAVFGPGDSGSARVLAMEAATISGLKATEEVCRQVDSSLGHLPLVTDGQSVPVGVEVIHLDGSLLSILAAERTLLNFLSRLSGIATETARYAAAIAGLGARVAATRKTDPGMRRLEKQAVVDGGGESHRAGLYDAVLIKDNHIAAAGIGGAVAAVWSSLGKDIDIEVEVDSSKQLEEAIKAGASRVLLDNMTPEEIRLCVELAAGRVTVEASGGIILENIRQFAAAGADVISVGAITRAAPGIDFSLEVEA